MKPDIRRAVAGGFAGTLVMTLIMYFVAPLMGMMKMDVAASLGNMLGMGWAMGMLMHVANGSVIFPLVYAFLLYRLLPGGPTTKGIVWGVILWFLSQAMVMPMMGAGFFSSKMGGMMAVVGSLVNHAIYGALLGWIAGPAANTATLRQHPGARVA